VFEVARRVLKKNTFNAICGSVGLRTVDKLVIELELLQRSVGEIVEWLLVFGAIRRPQQQLSRNNLIRLRFAAGETLSE